MKDISNFLLISSITGCTLHPSNFCSGGYNEKEHVLESDEPLPESLASLLFSENWDVDAWLSSRSYFEYWQLNSKKAHHIGKVLVLRYYGILFSPWAHTSTISSCVNDKIDANLQILCVTILSQCPGSHCSCRDSTMLSTVPDKREESWGRGGEGTTHRLLNASLQR